MTDTTKACRSCGKPFQSYSVVHQWCTTECRMKHARPLWERSQQQRRREQWADLGKPPPAPPLPGRPTLRLTLPEATEIVAALGIRQVRSGQRNRFVVHQLREAVDGLDHERRQDFLDHLITTTDPVDFLMLALEHPEPTIEGKAA